MSFLIDTNVLCEPHKPSPNLKVLSWLQGSDSATLYISSLTIGEIRFGVENMRKKSRTKAVEIETWLAKTQMLFADRIIPVSAEIADYWGVFKAIRPLPVIDGLLAATAKVHQLILVTRNVEDFKGLDIQLKNPWS